MKKYICAITLALFFSANGASAVAITVNGSNVSLLTGGNLTVTDNALATYKEQVSSGTLGQFNSSLGVLTGATATIAVPTSPTTLTQTGTGMATEVSSVWSIGGNIDLISLANTSPAALIDSSWNNVILSSSIANLNNFVGTGNITNNSITTYIGASNFPVFGSPPPYSSTTTATVNKDLIGAQSIVYTYTFHSNASFNANADANVLIVDLGQIDNGIDADYGFSIFSLAGGLGLTDFDVSFMTGDDVFAITGGSSIGVGNSNVYNAHFNAQTPGVQTLYNGTYRITFTDDVSGLGGNFASNSVGTNSIDIALMASVPEPLVTSVPEPETYTLLLAGLGLMGSMARRRKQTEI